MPGKLRLSDKNGKSIIWSASGGRIALGSDRLGFVILRLRKQSPSLVFGELNKKIGQLNAELRSRAELARSAAHLAAVVKSSADAIITKDLDGRVTSWNSAAERMFGYASHEVIGQPISKLLPPDRVEEEASLIENARFGQQIQSVDTARIRKDGTAIDVSVTISPIFDSSGEIVGVSSIAHDITQRKQSEEHTRLLMREVNHRSKNLLAVVQSIARQTAGDTGPEEFTRSFLDRLQALSACQDLLIESDWKAVNIHDLVVSQMSHLTDKILQRVFVEGDRFKLNASAAQGIGMAVHELATNALKYGALSNATGKVHIICTRVKCGKTNDIKIVWKEQGGPPVKQPAKTGFGRTVIERMVTMAVNGLVDLDYNIDGFKWQLVAPADGTVVE